VSQQRSWFGVIENLCVFLHYVCASLLISFGDCSMAMLKSWVCAAAADSNVLPLYVCVWLEQEMGNAYWDSNIGNTRAPPTEHLPYATDVCERLVSIHTGPTSMQHVCVWEWKIFRAKVAAHGRECKCSTIISVWAKMITDYGIWRACVISTYTCDIILLACVFHFMQTSLVILCSDLSLAFICSVYKDSKLRRWLLYLSITFHRHIIWWTVD
jgi:hypothetical protein